MLNPGTRLGPYQVQVALGAGGMGEVYRARDTRLDRTVAIKVLPPHVASDIEVRQRFEVEARVVAALNHPHICVLHDIGLHEGLEFLVMEYIAGETLATRLARGRLPLEQAVQIAIQIADALSAAHAAGIIHRDLKPANVMLGPTGAKLLDFGVAKLRPTPFATGSPYDPAALPTQRTPLTTRGTVFGTLNYMAPELLEGVEADARSDIFALGAVLYEMVTGRKAFEGNSQSSVILSIMSAQPPPIPEVRPLTSPLLDRIVRHSLAKEPNARWESAHDILLQLKWLHEGEVTGTSAVARSRARAAAAGAALATAVALVTAAAMVVLRPPPPLAPSPVTRFAVVVPHGQALTRTGRHVVALSPDGSRLVYVADRQLYARALDRLEPAPIRGTDDDPSEPVFSPDGQWVAYWAMGQIKKVPVAGGVPVPLAKTDNPWGASWSGETILIGQGPNGILSVPAAGGAPTTLIKLDASRGEAAHGPQSLPGGDAVLFTLRRGTAPWDDAQIVVQSIKTGARRVVIEAGTDAHYVATGHLVYAREAAIFAAPFDLERLVAGAATSVVENVTQATEGATGAAHFAVTAGGALAYFPEPAEPVGPVVWVDRQGRESPVFAEVRAYGQLRISPDHTRVALDTRDQEHDIWIREVGGAMFTRLTFGRAQEEYALWTPDGARVVFSSTQDGPRQVFWKRADGSGAIERLTAGTSVGFPQSISPDGRLLIIRTVRDERERHGFDLALVELDGDRRPRPLLPAETNTANAEISPDGRWLAYQVDESGRSEVFVRPFPAVDQGRWQISLDGGTRPIWSRNGRELFYVNERLWMVAVPVQQTNRAFHSGKPEPLFDAQRFNLGARTRAFDIDREGQRFLMLTADRLAEQARFVVVQNWFEELRGLARSATSK